jgi:hypothetical protein
MTREKATQGHNSRVEKPWGGGGLAPPTSSQNGIQVLVEQLIIGRPHTAVCHAPLRYIFIRRQTS